MKKFLDQNGLLYLWQKITNAFVKKETGKGLSTNDLTDDLKETYDGTVTKVNNLVASGGEPNTIDIIKVNGTTQSITNKTVDITVPTNNNQLTNGAGYQTASDVDTAIRTAISSMMTYKGTVATKDSLPSNASVGDTYNVTDTGKNYAWNGTEWDDLGGTIDLSGYVKTTDIGEISNSEIDTIVAS